MENSNTEIRSIFAKNTNYTVVEFITPNPEQSKNAFQLEDSNGAKMLDKSGEMTMVATAFSIDELVKIHDNEVKNKSLGFYL